MGFLWSKIIILGGKRRNAAHQEQKMVLLAPLGIMVPSSCINTQYDQKNPTTSINSQCRPKQHHGPI